jgi:cysteine dioxygenase
VPPLPDGSKEIAMSLAPRLASASGTAPRLQALLDALDRQDASPIALSTLESLLKHTELQPEDVAPYCLFRPDCYSRNLIYAKPHFEVLALCWRSKQFSPFHDHSHSACAVRVLQGIMTNIDAVRVGDQTVRALRTMHQFPGTVDGRYDTDIHQVGNPQASGDGLISLHIYSPPLTHMNCYRLEGDPLEPARAG